MTGKFDEYCVWTDDESSLLELDAEHVGQSVRERIDVAVQAKAKRQLPARYFYEVIEETADDFLVEGQTYPENQQRFDEIQNAYHELLPAFRVLSALIEDDSALDCALRDVMWSSFLIGLACDRERLENPEILEKYSSAVAAKARFGRKEKQTGWDERFYTAVRAAIPIAIEKSKYFIKPTKSYETAKNLLEYVADELEKTEKTEEAKLLMRKRLKVNAIRKAMKRFIDEENLDVSS